MRARRSRSAVLAMGLFLAGLVLAAPLVGAAPQAAFAEYRVVASAGAAELTVEARLRPGGSDGLVLGRSEGRFARDVQVKRGDVWAAVPRGAQGVWQAGCAARGCEVRYRYLLAEAAEAIDDVGSVAPRRGALLAAPSSWLLTPERSPADARFRLEVKTPPGLTFVSGLFPDGLVQEGSAAKPGRTETPEVPLAPLAYAGPMSALDDAPYSAFGTFTLHAVRVPGGTVVVAFTPGETVATRAELLVWIEHAADAVARYYGGFPVPRAALLVLLGGSGHVGSGTTTGNGGASILISPGAQTTAADLEDDWVLTHEMVHLAFPSLRWPHRWLEEGIATYVEPLARVRAGRLPADRVWDWLLWGLPKGQPESGDQGLDHTPTWGRTYWGGALFCTVADVEIRERTGNKKSLDDALRAIVAAGGTQVTPRDVAWALRIGDRAVGVAVLEPLYEKMRAAPAPVDLDTLWKRLGVRREGKGIVYDDAAPLAKVRRGIASPPN